MAFYLLIRQSRIPSGPREAWFGFALFCLNYLVFVGSGIFFADSLAKDGLAVFLRLNEGEVFLVQAYLAIFLLLRLVKSS